MNYELEIVDLNNIKHVFTQNEIKIDDIGRNKLSDGLIETKIFFEFNNMEKYNLYNDVLIGGFKDFKLHIKEPIDYIFERHEITDSDYFSFSSMKDGLKTQVVFIN